MSIPLKETSWSSKIAPCLPVISGEARNRVGNSPERLTLECKNVPNSVVEGDMCRQHYCTLRGEGKLGVQEGKSGLYISALGT